ncbi:hypothetical protein SAMN05428975_3203 [Mucilaginibacter sp. OK268]|uniref:hypothetical protein n=1 Tax=Mucilaginibacter sp. OK268 TaxID=1881048 RepID=UPI00088EB02A|nr:hypothetical protein [Mucilaginibacter sp. OK268]SDP87118.1 hypothetical protein SAMN05428975_3203 [Mucilaginibacter sp. OK268]
MKKIILLSAAILLSAYCKAQTELAFPFQGGGAVMTRFFRDSLKVSPEIIKKKASGTAVFKFTADEKGTIKKIIVYYADDYVLTLPIIEALKKSNHKWVIPDHEKLHDFIIPFSISFNPPAMASNATIKEAYKFYSQRKPIISYNQVPLEYATLLPTVVVSYDIPE